MSEVKCIDARDAYLASGFSPGEVQYRLGASGQWIIMLTIEGIANHFADGHFASRTIVHGNYCESGLGWWDGWRGGEVTSFTGYDTSCPYNLACQHIEKIQSRLGCYSWPFYGSGVGDAVANQNLVFAYGDNRNSYDCNRGCLNLAAYFRGAAVVDGEIVFRTFSELDTDRIMVLGCPSWDRVNWSDWTDRRSWKVLRAIEPRGGRGVLQTYVVGGLPEMAVYRIVELDRWGRASFSEPIIPGRVPEGVDEWLRNPRVELDAPVQQGTEPRMLRETVGLASPRGGCVADGAKNGHEDLSSVTSSLSPDTMTDPDSTLCADVVVYTACAYESLLGPVQEHLAGYPVKARYFTGSSSPAGAQVAYNEVYWANYYYNVQSGTERFPTDDPGPLLILVGDSWPLVVDYMVLPDSHDRCQGSCKSDRMITDISGTGPIGLAHRIPGDTVDEIERACLAADDWNSGVLVDPLRRVVMTLGDRYGDGVAEELVELAQDAANVFAGQGFMPNSLLREADYEPAQHEEREEDFTEQIEAGAAYLWGFGLVTTNNTWPGRFATNISGATAQRITAILPGCDMLSSYLHGRTYVEDWMFAGPDSTMLAGMVGNLDGGWEPQHEVCEELLMQAWADAPAGVPLDYVAWAASKEAEAQGLTWVSDYFLSVGTFGAYVLKPDWDSLADVECRLPEDRDLKFWAESPFKHPRLAFTLPRQGSVLLRVFDAGGRLAVTLKDTTLDDGTHHTMWNGLDDTGAALPCGVYLLRLDVEGHPPLSKKIVLLR